MTPVFNPGPIEHPNIPIYISAVNPYNCRLAGELCDRLAPARLQHAEVPARSDHAAGRGRREEGRAGPLKDVDIAGLGFIITGRNSAELTKNAAPVRRQISFYASTPGYRAVMDIHGWGDVFERLFEMSKRGEWAAMSELITDDMLEEFCTIATYDELVPKLLKHYGGVTTRAALRDPDHDARRRSDAEVDDHATAISLERLVA